MALTSEELNVLNELTESLDPIIHDRGIDIFHDDRVSFLGEDTALKVYEFSVQGSGINVYIVNICLNEEIVKYAKEVNLDVASKCSCIYYQKNQSCKHVAAAACYLDFYSEEKFRKSKSQKKVAPIKIVQLVPNKTLFPITISCGEDDLDNLAERLPFINTQATPKNLQNVELADNSITYVVILIGYSVRLTVVFDPINEQVRITCSNISTSIQEQAVVFLQLLWKHTTNADLELLTNSQRAKAKRKKLADLGLLGDVSNPDTALKLGFSNGGFRFIYAGELEGMKDVMVFGKDFKDFSSLELMNPNVKTLAEKSDSKEYGLYNVAFALAINERGDLYNLFPFIAKGKKNDPGGYHVRFELLEYADDIRLAKNDNLERLLLDVKQVKSYKERKKYELLHGVFNAFIDSVDNEYPIYRSEGSYGSYYYSDRFHKSDIKEVLEFQSAELDFTLVKSKSIFEFQAWLTLGEQRLNLAEVSKDLLMSEIFGFYKNRIILLFAKYADIALLNYWNQRVPVRFAENMFPEFAKQVLKPLSEFAKFTDETGMISEVDLGIPLERELYVSEISGLVIFEPKVRYNAQISSNPLTSTTLFDIESNTIYLRDSNLENKFVSFLKDLHPSFTNTAAQGYFSLKHSQFTAGNWFLETFGQLEKQGIKVFGLDKLTLKRYSPFPASISMNVSSNSDWFEINTQLKFGDYAVKLKDIRQAVLSDERFVRLGDGSLGQIPDKWLRKFSKLIQSSEVDGEKVKLSKIHFSLLTDFEEDISSPAVEKELAEKKARLQSFEEIRTVEVPKGIQAELRNYQKAGLNWLNFLQEYSWGGILADDMGLGKTLQVITLISQMAEKGAIRVLIIAPTTLLFNWRNELEKFAPHLDYFIHHGDRSDKAEDLQAHSIVLTSYGLVINDLDLLSSLEFDLIVADESQAIKNVTSLRYKSIIKLRGKLKLAMTGTPIENGIAELFAHMNFVNPGFFKTFNGFKEQYIKELRNGNPETMQDLRKKIQPFVLRRTKEEVLTELPDKIEEYLYCEMGAPQKKVYEAYRNEYRDFLQGKFEEEGSNQSKMYVLEGLTKLRQICDSPDLISKDKKGAKSAKIDMLMEHIVEKTGNHKILIFSQFVKMLDLVKKEMITRNIPFSYLDGKSSMKDRESSVNEFQEDNSIRVFLISLKAGGTGLNLTAADYVYILDPWWNPAVENQAIDRCYRMGQDKKVMAYRMICKDTVEEKIMELQKSKLKLAKDVISEGDGFLTGMNGATMLKLFE
jgi:SNF2 family DNA or RNA helicase